MQQSGQSSGSEGTHSLVKQESALPRRPAEAKHQENVSKGGGSSCFCGGMQNLWATNCYAITASFFFFFFFFSLSLSLCLFIYICRYNIYIIYIYIKRYHIPFVLHSTNEVGGKSCASDKGRDGKPGRRPTRQRAPGFQRVASPPSAPLSRSLNTTR